jgi:hypothetical protein
MRRAELERHLEQVARQPASSGRAAQARVQALKALGRFDRPRATERRPMPEDWHPGPAEMEDLDADDPP